MGIFACSLSNVVFSSCKQKAEPAEQADRVKNWEERIAKAKEKKEVADAKAIVEAEQIRKRKRRRTAAKDKKGKVVAPKEG